MTAGRSTVSQIKQWPVPRAAYRDQERIRARSLSDANARTHTGRRRLSADRLHESKEKARRMAVVSSRMNTRNQAMIFLITSPATSVRRKSRPLKR